VNLLSVLEEAGTSQTNKYQELVIDFFVDQLPDIEQKED
jgi:hypothetical protein